MKRLSDASLPSLILNTLKVFVTATLLHLAPGGDTANAVEVTSFRATSDPGDFIGQGFDGSYTPETAGFSATQHSGYSVSVNVWATELAEFWSLDFAAPYAQPLAPGVYLGARNWPLASEPRLDISALGHGCISATGRFEVLEIQYGPGLEVLSFRARFQQFCDGSLSSLQGEIRYRANVHVELSVPKYVAVLADQPLQVEVQGPALDGTQSILTSEGLPEGATFVDHGVGQGTLSWTPAVAQAGAHFITFSAHDALGRGESVQTEISVGRTVRVPAEFPTIQAAIDSAIPGSHIIVAPGTYAESLDFLGKPITVRSDAGPEVTILDGGSERRVVTFDQVEKRDSVLLGFTIRNGWTDARPPDSLDGGGISVYGASPTILDNIIEGNRGYTGGGIHVSFGSPLIQGNTVADNVGGSGSGGAGIHIGGAAKAEVVGNTIENNHAIFYGGGIAMWAAGTPRIEGNVIRGNTAQEGGGIWMVNWSDAEIIGNIIYGNKADTGGGVHWFGRQGFRGPRLVNNTIAENDAPEGSAITADAFDSTAELINNVIVGKQGQNALWCGTLWDPGPPILWHNNVYSLGGSAYGGSCVNMTGTDGNISAEPSFACPEVADFRLVTGSHVIDAGDNAIPGLPDLDFLDGPRVLDGDHDGTAIVDLGAYEFDPEAPPVDPCIYAFCPGDIQIDAPRGATQASVTYAPPAAPARATVDCSVPSGSAFPEGTTIVSCSAALTSGHSASCEFTVTVFVRPLNDLVENATVITTLPFTDQIDTRFATAGNEPYCSGQAPAIWYKYTPVEDMVITLDATGSSYGLQLSAYTRPDDIYYGGNICGPGPFTYLIRGGTTHWFGVRPTAEGGNLDFNVRGHVPLKLDLGIDQSVIDRKTGEARITGTATCSLSSEVTVSGQLVIPGNGSSLVRPFSAAIPSCIGTTSWEVTLPPTGERVPVRGVTISLTGHAEDPVWGEEADASAALTLRPTATRRTAGSKNSKK